MLSTIKTIIGISDATQDSLLNALIDLTSARLKSRIGSTTVPEQLNPVVIEVVIARYNRIGSEGPASHSVEGESMGWNNDDDFAPYEKDIQRWLSAQKDNKQGVVRFI